MAIVNGSLQIGKKDSTFFSANPTLILGDGQLIYNETTGDLFIGDGVTSLNSLVAINGGGAGTWGSITGTLSNQTDLQTALNAKLNLSGSNANQDIDIGNYGLDAKFIKVKGTAGNGRVCLKHQSANITAAASESSLGADSSGNPVWKNDGNAIESIELQTNKTSTVTGNETSTSKYLTVKGVYDWVTGLFVKKGTLTTNTIPKATASDTIGDSQITDDGSTVTINNKLSVLKNTVGTGQKGVSVNFNTIGEVFYIDDNGYLVYNANAGATFKGSNGIIDVVSNGGTEPILSFKYNNGSNTSGLIKGSSAKLIIDTPLLELSQLTASQIVATDASKNLQSLSTATYPSLTELSYVKGLTSAIQTQLNAKRSTTTEMLLFSGAFSNTNLAASTTYYWSNMNGMAATTTQSFSKFNFANNFTVTKVVLTCSHNNNPSSGNTALYIRESATTDKTITTTLDLNTVGANTSKVFVYSGLSLSVTSGTDYEIKTVTPAMVTVPTNCRWHIQLWGY